MTQMNVYIFVYSIIYLIMYILIEIVQCEPLTARALCQPDASTKASQKASRRDVNHGTLKQQGTGFSQTLITMHWLIVAK
jgi:hypothetical protein